MDKWLWLMVLVLSSGCAVTTVNTPPQQTAVSSTSFVHVFPSDDVIRKLLLGISREEALALIGRTTNIGYELRQGSVDEYQAVTSPNPHRSQQITRGKDVYQVDFYLTKINKADGVITDDELTPLVFESNKLIGKDWNFFKTKIKN